MNLKEYAEHRRINGLRGTSHVAVLKAIEAGRIAPPAVMKRGRNWVIDPSLADAQWSESTVARLTARDTARDAREARAARAASDAPPRPRAAAAVTAPLTAPPASKGPSKAQADAVRVAFQAKLLELDFEERQGRLVSRQEINGRAFQEMRRVRDSLMRLPLQAIGDISQIVGSITPEQRAEVLIVLDRHVVEVLQGCKPT
jgi:hypothetical protein